MARRVLDALRGAGHTTVTAAHLEHAATLPPEDQVAALGAVRLLGADVLAPYVLTGSAPPAEETVAVAAALDALPPAQPPPAAPPGGPEPAWVRAWIDWSLVTVLARIDPAVTAPTAPEPPPPPRCAAPTAPRHAPATAEGGVTHEGWVPWSVLMGQLSPLALPGLDGPVHQAARSGATGLARGATRAVLRRDFPTAARITRWLAWLHAEGVRLPLDPAPLTEHITLLGGGGRVALDTAIAGRLLGLESV
ncbi:hypothetical protein OKJ48_12350 [Streptomyces kunmingensis]|uniref:Uncharacterized protein n=1 Tax=Streptomyces kunmingensis TaxID=68225 RepID=A0ABU6C8I5_9ACTN|nr:hypothetical protein [Streptomyces kunmingensis]MEB3961029.1 hypothetical protein [Streptomyces kunmingensis]